MSGSWTIRGPQGAESKITHYSNSCILFKKMRIFLFELVLVKRRRQNSVRDDWEVDTLR